MLKEADINNIIHQLEIISYREMIKHYENFKMEDTEKCCKYMLLIIAEQTHKCIIEKISNAKLPDIYKHLFLGQHNVLADEIPKTIADFDICKKSVTTLINRTKNYTDTTLGQLEVLSAVVQGNRKQPIGDSKRWTRKMIVSIEAMFVDLVKFLKLGDDLVKRNTAALPLSFDSYDVPELPASCDFVSYQMPQQFHYYTNMTYPNPNLYSPDYQYPSPTYQGLATCFNIPPFVPVSAELLKQLQAYTTYITATVDCISDIMHQSSTL
ncbi:DUF1394 domain-containing protein [Caenorhabditis elegans]|uniref:DUF1394 domain-containing protein n=1 Tax=Caenorhabditis elegans TaxID=6239 RepID=Q22726_CAEEL|nr:DUF1394 domain-containing protein [Caenorhabditis elegans]CAA92201.1 DUF1394 domain-containing protein [Caenorhabditis elegans]|eukprot:NP_510420.1 Uncharacterized protein CELE_T24C2.3 [Caenorhabditis elegans]